MFETITVPAKPKRRDERKRAYREDEEQKPKQQPPYHVILWNDDDHSYEYVIRMLHALFGHRPEMGFLLADKVDKTGCAIVCTTTKEHAELKQEQIHAFGPDEVIPDCAGSMSATIEPAETED